MQSPHLLLYKLEAGLKLHADADANTLQAAVTL
jgi:hypothetical protein